MASIPSGWVLMDHPGTAGTAIVTQKAFDEVWSVLGWAVSELGAPDVYTLPNHMLLALNPLFVLKSEVLPGTVLAHAERSDQVAISAAAVDLLTVTFTVPTDRAVEVRAKVANVSSTTANVVNTAVLTDESNVQKDTDSWRGTTTTSLGSHFLLEVIPAGSGIVTRKVRQSVSGGVAASNVVNTGRSYLTAYVR